MAAVEKDLNLNTSLFLDNALINDILMVQALVDNGCLCFGIINDKLVEMQLSRILMALRFLQTAEESSMNKSMVKRYNIHFIGS